MELVTLKITPRSSFVTYPKGDMLFGQIVSFLYQKGETIFDNYLEASPKLIVSDMMPYGYVYKPTLPLKCFNTEEKKEFRKRKFINIDDLQKGNLTFENCKKIDFFSEISIVKNSINRETFSTQGANFAPYGYGEIEFHRYLWMFILVNKDIKEIILDTLEEIGNFGFGKEASIGKGRFSINMIDNPINFKINTSYFMSISPTILKDSNIKASYYEPFVRFGKYGLDKANENAFKKPVLLADSAAVVKLENEKNYFGKAINNGYSHKPSYLQGYSISIPFVLKDEKCLE